MNNILTRSFDESKAMKDTKNKTSIKLRVYKSCIEYTLRTGVFAVRSVNGVYLKYNKV